MLGSFVVPQGVLFIPQVPGLSGAGVSQCGGISGQSGWSLGCPLPGIWDSGPCVTVTPLTRMIDWVSWPLGKNIDKWIIALLKGLAAVKKFSILIEVSLAKIEKVGGPLS